MKVKHNATLVLIFTMLLTLGCQPPYRNEPLETFAPAAGYRFDTLELGQGNTDDLFVACTFSGGGTRAAALAYGVLLGLRDSQLPPGPGGVGERCFLDEVDLISSVSGGSFTALAYGLWRDDIFGGEYEKRFLRHNVQGDLMWRALNPANLVQQPFITKDAIDIAVEYYDEKIFGHRTYADLLEKGTRPFIVVNATDAARQQQLSFIQYEFNILGSDLAKLPVAWAAAASSAFPILLTPLRFKYYPDEPMADAIRQTLSSGPSADHFHHRWAASLIDRQAWEQSGEVHIDSENHKYMYLIDGGVVDNLGLHPVFRAFVVGPVRERIEKQTIKRFVIVVVNAGTQPPNKVEHSASAPGRLSIGATTATSGIAVTTELSSNAMKYIFLHQEPKVRRLYEQFKTVVDERYPDVTPPELPAESRVVTYIIDINFHELKDYVERQKMLTLPTNFALEDDQVDALIDVGQRLLKKHPEYRRLMNDLENE